MCGIVGVRHLNGQPVEPELLRQMARSLEHRGPDGEGYWTEASVGFGHRRLSIIDLEGSVQPMADPSGSVHICFNGEILNYPALKKQLDYPFRTSGDTETILAAYQAFGMGVATHLIGQFAFALHDSKINQTILFRDRLGILPLYYYTDHEIFAFASEIKALFPVLARKPEVDETTIVSYLTHRSVPAPDTLFKGIKKLKQGHHLTIAGSGEINIQPYWTIPDASSRLRLTRREAIDRLDLTLRSAVESALVADVPVGAYLSGGVDSSLIVSLITSLRGGGGTSTFTAGFGDPRHDELPFARQVSSLLRTDHHEVSIRTDDLLELWP